jgi:dolichol-phosphate mannosyltransferase
MGNPEITLVLPVFNEEANLGPLLTRVDEAMSASHLSYCVLVVDDGSTDATSELLRSFESRLPLRISRHARNEGLGYTLRDGLVAAAGVCAADDIIVTMDADDTHHPALISGMMRKIRDGFDVVIASRFQPGARCYGVPVHRRMLSFAASSLFRLLLPTDGVRDFTCGYRAYRAGVLQSAIATYGDSFLESDGFQCMIDVLLHLRALGARFTEVPVVLRYDRKRGASKMRVMRTIRQTLLLIARRRITDLQARGPLAPPR